MNDKQMSKIRNKAKHLLVEWLTSLLSKEEASKITLKMYLILYLIKHIICKVIHLGYNPGHINGLLRN